MTNPCFIKEPYIKMWVQITFKWPTPQPGLSHPLWVKWSTNQTHPLHTAHTHTLCQQQPWQRRHEGCWASTHSSHWQAPIQSLGKHHLILLLYLARFVPDTHYDLHYCTSPLHPHWTHHNRHWFQHITNQQNKITILDYKGRNDCDRCCASISPPARISLVRLF